MNDETNIMMREFEMDWKGVIDLAFDRKGWGKIYTVYTYGDINVTCMMKEFNFEEESAWFRMKVDLIYKEKRYEEIKLLYYPLNHFTQEDFKRIMKNKLLRLLEEIRYNILKKEARAEHDELYHDPDDLDDADVREAGYGDDLDVIEDLSEEIRDNMLEVLREKSADKLNEEFDLKVSEYMINNNLDHPNLLRFIEKLEEGKK